MPKQTEYRKKSSLKIPDLVRFGLLKVGDSVYFENHRGHTFLIQKIKNFSAN